MERHTASWRVYCCPLSGHLRFWDFKLSNLRRNGGLPNGRVHTMNDNKTPLQGFDPQSFGKRLQSARKAIGITQEEFAAQLRVDCNHIARME